MKEELKVVEEATSDFPWVVVNKTGLPIGRFTTKIAAENARIAFTEEKVWASKSVVAQTPLEALRGEKGHTNEF